MEDNDPIDDHNNANSINNINSTANITNFLNVIHRENSEVELNSISHFMSQLNRSLFDANDTGYSGNITNDILQNSLIDQGGVKNIISDEGELQLREMTYNSTDYKNSTCPIMQNDFIEGDLITMLPCNHVFYPEGIYKWLRTVKAECPICRCKLSSKEVCNSPPHSDEDEDDDTLVDEMIEDDDALVEDADAMIDEGTIHLFNENISGLERNIEIIGNSLNPLIRGMVQNMLSEDSGITFTFPIENDINDINDIEIEHDLNNASNEDDINFQLALYASVVKSVMDANID